MKLSEFLEKENYLSLPKIDKPEIEVLWACDYWDGPKSGMLRYQNKKYWFQVFSESEDPDVRDYYRRFCIVQLTDEQLKAEEYWHAHFKEKVGSHTDGGGINKKALEHLKSKEEQAEFYEAYKHRQPRDLLNNMVIGWFET